MFSCVPLDPSQSHCGEAMSFDLSVHPHVSYLRPLNGFQVNCVLEMYTESLDESDFGSHRFCKPPFTLSWNRTFHISSTNLSTFLWRSTAACSFSLETSVAPHSEKYWLLSANLTLTLRMYLVVRYWSFVPDICSFRYKYLITKMLPYILIQILLRTF